MRKFNEGFSKEAIKLNGAKFYYSNRYKIDRVYRQPSKKQELFSALKNYVSFFVSSDFESCIVRGST